MRGARVVARVEDAGEGDDREQEQDRVRDDGDLVHEEHELVAVDDDHDHERADQRVDHRPQQGRVADARETAERPDDGVAADPHRDRVERDRGEQREERADDPAAHPDVGAGGDGVVRAGARTEQAHRREDQRADDHAEQRGGHGLPERQPEGDRERAEQHGGERVGATELDAEQVERAGGALAGRDRVDPVLLHLRDARRGGGDAERRCSWDLPRIGGRRRPKRSADVSAHAMIVDRGDTRSDRPVRAAERAHADVSRRPGAAVPAAQHGAARRLQPAGGAHGHPDGHPRRRAVPLRGRRAEARRAAALAIRGTRRRRRCHGPRRADADHARAPRRRARRAPAGHHRAAAHRMEPALRARSATSTTRTSTPRPAGRCSTPACAPSGSMRSTSTRRRIRRIRASGSRCTTSSRRRRA